MRKQAAGGFGQAARDMFSVISVLRVLTKRKDADLVLLPSHVLLYGAEWPSESNFFLFKTCRHRRSRGSDSD